MKLFRFLMIMLLAGKAIIADAQFSDSVHHMVNVTASGNINRTNDGTTYLFNNSLKYGLRLKDFVLNLNNSWVYGANQQKLTNNDFISSLDCNLYKTFPHFYYWGLVNFTTSYSLRINGQLQTGVGLAYRIIDKSNMMLSVSDGILYEHSSIANEESSNFVYSTYRNSLRIQYRVNHKDLVKLTSAGFYQPSLQYGNDYILMGTIRVDVKIWKWLNLTTAVTYNNLSRTNRENTLFTYGLIAERFF